MIIRIFLSALTSVAFSVIFHVRGAKILWSGVCGALGYTIYLLLGQGHYTALFYAGLTITLAAEIIARKTKTPATLFLVGGLLPLVPGKEMFRIFMAVMQGRQTVAMTHFWNTILQAGALTAGTMIIGSVLHLITLLKKRKNTATPKPPK